MNAAKKILKSISILLVLLPLSALVVAAVLAADGATIYNANCAGCHRLGTFDTTGSAPDLMGDGSKVTSYYTGGVSGHKGITLASADITTLAAFVNNPVTTTPLTISTSTLSGATIGTSYSQTLAASGGRTPYTWTRSSGTLPAGLSLSSSGVISGTPTTAGTSSFTVMATDSSSPTASATRSLSITTAAAPAVLTITTTSLSGATVGTAYSRTLTAAGGRTPYTWTRSSGTLPAGLSLSSSGVISGTPTTAGTSSFTVRVTDSSSPTVSATRSLSITTATAAAPLSITTSSLAGGTVGTSYSRTLAATGGVTPYTWSYSGTPPPGIVVTSAGAVSGTPTTAGTYSFTVRVADSRSTAATKALSLTIAAATPMSTADKNLFLTNCVACHTPTGVQNSSASRIQTAITGNVGGMGTTQLKSLTTSDLNGIARSLVPQSPPETSCASCHASSPSPTPTPTTGKALYDADCAGCHRLGSYDTTGSAPDLYQSTRVDSYYSAGSSGHKGLTLSATDISNLKAFLNNPTGTSTPPPTQLTGQQLYDRNCAGCHKLGTYDTAGSAPSLSGDGSKLGSYYTAGSSGHKGVTLSAADLSNLAAFINAH